MRWTRLCSPTFFPQKVGVELFSLCILLFHVLWKGLPIVSNIPFLNPLEELLKRLLPTRASTSMLVSTLTTSQENLRNIVRLPLGDGFKGCFFDVKPYLGKMSNWTDTFRSGWNQPISLDLDWWMMMMMMMMMMTFLIFVIPIIIIIIIISSSSSSSSSGLSTNVHNFEYWHFTFMPVKGETTLAKILEW